MYIFKVNDNLTYAIDKYAEKNDFIGKQQENVPLPVYEDIKDNLPQLVWDGHDDAVNCYNETWRVAFQNLRKPAPGGVFINNFTYPAFRGIGNDFSIFMWGSCFSTMFGKYAVSVFDFQKTLNNFYANQHKDGFICREINNLNGDRYSRDDPSSTGPNIFAWTELEYYKFSGNKERLNKIFDPLMAFHNWLRLNRTWQNGTYWSSGWGCGMDNILRHQPGYKREFSHGHMSWIDICLQQILNARALIEISKIIDRADETDELQSEADMLCEFINKNMWDEKSSFYYDLWRNGEMNYVKHIGAYWALLADIVPKDKMKNFIAHLDNEKEFKRPHRIPALPADSKHYKFGDDDWVYWNGGVWPPTNYMVLNGLAKQKYDDLAYEIAVNDVENVVKVFNDTGILWEDYNSEYAKKGNPAQPNIVGWTGIVPVAILFEYVFGIKTDMTENKIVWNIRRTEKHGIKKYPFKGGFVDLICESYQKGEEPVVNVTSTVPVSVEIVYDGKRKALQ